MLTSLHDFIAASLLTTREMPLFGCPVPAGFPSPADDHLDGPFDLTKHLFRHPASTFLARVSGDSMIGAGIHPGDLVAVDRALQPRHGSIVVAVVEGEHTIKRLQERGGQPWLVAENARYPPVPVNPETGLLVWGVVTYVIHSLGEHQLAKIK
ncbi:MULTISPECIES: LexA family protein [Hymenobacter]|uniref:Translesion error-prone DNA polymerase V autoproteolytic subunit n=1 Tax=Hymenobacter armeniacus TaxID=2771358 RepID=A0ABR8JTR7_9BACT|nr:MULTISPECIES: translesion error-prone DNA polymerase V autoproteolytic subunit [Hymenobacter]MBD2722291.1 translesion error-prone DNA polymerase V autoproteolytic subunit [Hymenobacter armeniacus]MBJ6111663.1 translesion error-prone DNA polymerase V autoproteolytic subunit [Hymenobacter sp. BT523]